MCRQQSLSRREQCQAGEHGGAHFEDLMAALYQLTALFPWLKASFEFRAACVERITRTPNWPGSKSFYVIRLAPICNWFTQAIHYDTGASSCLCECPSRHDPGGRF